MSARRRGRKRTPTRPTRVCAVTAVACGLTGVTDAPTHPNVASSHVGVARPAGPRPPGAAAGTPGRVTGRYHVSRLLALLLRLTLRIDLNRQHSRSAPSRRPAESPVGGVARAQTARLATHIIYTQLALQRQRLLVGIPTAVPVPNTQDSRLDPRAAKTKREVNASHRGGTADRAEATPPACTCGCAAVSRTRSRLIV